MRKIKKHDFDLKDTEGTSEKLVLYNNSSERKIWNFSKQNQTTALKKTLK